MSEETIDQKVEEVATSQNEHQVTLNLVMLLQKARSIDQGHRK